MTHRWIALLGLLALVLAAPAQRTRDGRPNDPNSIGRPGSATLPDGRSRTLSILKKDVDKSSEDMDRVVELATELRDEIEKNQFHTVDLRSVRKAEEIVKLVRRVKSRLSRSQ